MKKSVLICGNYGASNLGDEAILQGILELLSMAFHQECEVAVLSSNPLNTTKLHRVSSYFLVPAGLRSFFRNIKNGELKRTFQKIKSCDLFLLGGGGLFTDEKFRAVMIWFLQVLVARVYRKKIVMLGQSVGPLKGWLARWLTKTAYSWSVKNIVRDEISAQLLKDLGVKEVTVLPDPAFFLQETGSSSQVIEDGNGSFSYVVLSLRPWIDGKDQQRAKILAEIIDWFELEHKMRTVLLPMQWHQDDDFTLLKQVAQLCKIAKATEVIGRAHQLPQILSHIQKAELVIGMRLHSLILSALVATPMVALSYSDKVDGVMNMLGMSDRVVPLQEVSVPVLKHQIETVLRDKLSLQSHLQKTVEHFGQEKNKYVEILQSIC